MEMSFREKSAWISFVLIVLVFGPYFWLVGRSVMGGAHVHGGTQFGLILLFVILEIVVHIAIAIQSPSDAQAPIGRAGRPHRPQGHANGVLRPVRRRADVDLHDALPGDRLDNVAVRAVLNRGCRAREVRQADRPLPARPLTWVAARFETAFVTCASTTRR